MPGYPTPQFPGALATETQLAVATNRLQTNLIAPLSAGVTSMTVASATGIVADSLLSIFQTNGSGTIVGAVEIVRVTANPIGNVCLIQRGYDGTTDAAHVQNSGVAGFVDAWHHNTLASEVKAIEASLGINLSNVATPQTFRPASYNFPAQTPGGSLSIGSNNINLSPMPAGIAIGQYLYISAGSGTAEAALITGIGSSNVIVTCANTHSGAWTIQSVNGGLTEATVAAGLVNGGTVSLDPSAQLTCHGKLTMSAGRITIDGQNPSGWLLVRAGDYTAGPLIDCISNGSIVNLKNFQINNVGGTVAAVRIFTGGNCAMADFQVNNGAVGIENDGGGGMQCRSWGASNTSSKGLWIHSSTGAIPTNIDLTSGFIFPAAGGDGVLLNAADGVVVTGLTIGGGRVQWNQNSTVAQYITSVTITNPFFDNATLSGVTVADSGSSDGLKIVGGYINGNGSATNQHGIDLGSSAASSILNFSISTTRVSGWGLAGIAIGVGVRNPSIGASTEIEDNNCSNSATYNAAVVLASGASSVIISGSPLKSPGVYTGHQAFAIKTLGSSSDLTIQGNDLTTNGTGAYSFSSPPTGSMVGPNNDGLPPGNFITSETGANNALVVSLPTQAIVVGLAIAIVLGHTTQVGVNTLNYNGHGADSLKSSNNPASNLSIALAVGAIMRCIWDGTVWQVQGQ